MQTYFTRGWLFLGLLLVAACAAPAPAGGGALEQWSGSQGGTEAAGHQVLRTTAEWDQFWAQVGQPRPRALQPAREMAVAVFLGEKRTGGHAIQVAAVNERGGRLVVTTTETAPPPGGMVTQALTYPWALVVVPASSLPVDVQRNRAGPSAR